MAVAAKIVKIDPNQLEKDDTPLPNLSEFITPTLPTHALLFSLKLAPFGSSTHAILKELGEHREIPMVLQLLLEPPFIGFHQDALMAYLRPRLQKLSVVRLMELQRLFPFTSFTLRDENNKCQPLFGPQTWQESNVTDVCDWFQQILHARQMKGESTCFFCYFPFVGALDISFSILIDTMLSLPGWLLFKSTPFHPERLVLIDRNRTCGFLYHYKRLVRRGFWVAGWL